MEKTKTKKDFTIDAKGKVLGRLATEIALILQGKNSVDYMPNKDIEHFVIVKNIEKIKITGRKMEDKIYFSHSGYLGGDKYTPMKVIFEKNPGDILVRAVSGMLPKNRLRARRIKRIKFE
ncbi:MAG TPA: 50S ribosomal protein L13 [Candidatus Pacearchaeota archaeon]|nr:50S ribosomal protein L13 [Candidatus Parcubacteria bacterium]HNP79371.1 50S ribosomal protein L13 [Candidatus Pacearchaeota archaeon]HOC53823.1 50S ribosomal protein L13 [Candidatus Pacearchaeota archaeon]HQM24559.1 50S ribosomal protein L13 [Candidatus Pacearchaeota archaeon]